MPTKPYETKMQKSLDNLKEEYSTIRAGRANPHLLDRIRVDYYGQPSSLQSVANVSVPEPRVILIQPWESSLIKVIEKEILASDLGLTPSNDGKAIRLVFPELTEERRKELVKDVKKKAEKKFRVTGAGEKIINWTKLRYPVVRAGIIQTLPALRRRIWKTGWLCGTRNFQVSTAMKPLCL